MAITTLIIWYDEKKTESSEYRGCISACTPADLTITSLSHFRVWEVFQMKLLTIFIKQGINKMEHFWKITHKISYLVSKYNF